jgi:hypothetical protein
MAATKEELKALAKLRAFVNAAVEVNDMFEVLGAFSVLDEQSPDGFVEFSDQLHMLIEWRDNVARSLGEPEGAGDGRPEAHDRKLRVPCPNCGKFGAYVLMEFTGLEDDKLQFRCPNDCDQVEVEV